MNHIASVLITRLCNGALIHLVIPFYLAQPFDLHNRMIWVVQWAAQRAVHNIGVCSRLALGLALGSALGIECRAGALC